MSQSEPSTPKQMYLRMEDAVAAAGSTDVNDRASSSGQIVRRREMSRRSSAEIIAATNEMRQRIESRKQRRSLKAKGKDISAAAAAAEDHKRELVMVEHKMGITELAAELLTDIEHVS
jgi:hypothetical protein